MKHRLTAVAAAVTAVLALTACGGIGEKSGTGAEAGEKATPTAKATSDQPTPGSDSDSAPASPTPSGNSGFGSVKDSGNIPDPCKLLSDADVKSLTRRAITQTDHDDATPGTDTRYCQWQQDSGQLAVFLSRTTESDYTIKIEGAQKVTGVTDPGTGDEIDSFSLAGHLNVLFGTVHVDVYSRGAADDAGNLADEKKIVAALLPKI